MFPTYNSLAEVPEAFQEHYVMKGGKAVPEVSSDHPLVTNNATLLNEKTAAEARATKAEGDLASAGASSLPRGHVAVPKAKADLLPAYEGLGTPDELTTLKTEHGTFKAEVETAKRDRHLRGVAEVLGYQPEAFAMLPGLPEFEIRDSSEKDAKGNPKKVAVAKVKDAAGVVTEKSGREFIESSETYRPLLPALQASGNGGGKSYVSQDAGGRAPANDLYAQIREDAKRRTEAKKEEAVPLGQRKGLTVIGAASN